jgi:NMD protein affecting ribosome stability and mRNA decay
MAKCYLCGTLETIHELDNLCEDCLITESEGEE